MQQTHDPKATRKKDWPTVIPVIFWLICIFFSVAKQFQGEESDKAALFLNVLNSFNESTFSTFITIVITLSYQYFSVDGEGKRRGIGLSREHIAMTIIATCLYGALALANALRYGTFTIILMTIASIIYVVLFFVKMRDMTSL